MAVVASQLVAEVKASGVEETKSQLKSVGGAAEETKGHFEGLKSALSFAAGQALFSAGFAGFNFLKDQLSDVFKLTMDHQQVMADTVNTLQHMGNVSGQTAQSIEKYAIQMSKLTTFSADDTQKAENLMLTFAHLGKEVFPLATTAALDMSQKLGQDLQSSVIQVGKALDNPVTGMTALLRVGVSFTDQEKAQIKTMQQHNDIMGAQKIILSELSKQFGGDAVTAGKTFAGQLDILGHQFDDMKIKIGTALLPMLTQLIGYVEKNVVPQLVKFSDWFVKDGVPLLQKFGNDLGAVIGWFQKGGPAVDALKDAFIGVGIAIATIKIVQFGRDVASAMKTGIDATTNLINMIGGIGPAAEGAEGGVKTASVGMKAAFGSVLTAALPLIAIMGNIEQFQNQQAHPFSSSDLGTNIKNAILNGIFPAGGIGDLQQNWNNITHGNAHAQGIMNNPTGHWATVGEKGPELMYVPQGASILPNGVSPSGSGSGSSQPIYLQVDGQTIARLMMPYIADQIRQNVPVYGA